MSSFNVVTLFSFIDVGMKLKKKSIFCSNVSIDINGKKSLDINQIFKVILRGRNEATTSAIGTNVSYIDPS